MSQKWIVSYRVPIAGGSIEAPSQAKFLQPAFQGGEIVSATVQDPPLPSGAYCVNSPVVGWDVTVALDGDEVPEIEEYRGSARNGDQIFHVFTRRRL